MNFLERQDSSSGSVGLIGQLNYQKIRSDGVSEISLQSFIPSVLATFVLYYLLGAVTVQAKRRFNSKILGE